MKIRTETHIAKDLSFDFNLLPVIQLYKGGASCLMFGWLFWSVEFWFGNHPWKVG